MAIVVWSTMENCRFPRLSSIGGVISFNSLLYPLLKPLLNIENPAKKKAERMDQISLRVIVMGQL